MLDAQTTLLSYNVDAEGVDLFVVSNARFEVVRIDVDEETLRERINRFRFLIQRGRIGQPADAPLLALGRELFADLIAPADLAADSRLVIVADGPLHALPFAALVASESETQSRYLIEQHAVRQVLSMTLAQQLTPLAASAERTFSLIAFGDPQHAAPLTTADTSGAYAAERARALPPLPHAQQESEGLREIYDAAATVFTGTRATEAAFRNLAEQAAILHVAAHTLVDHGSPPGIGAGVAFGRCGD